MQDKDDKMGRHELRLRKNADDIRTWVIACPIAYTVLAKMSGLTRRTIYTCHNYEVPWNPTFHTMVSLSKARDMLESQIRNPTPPKARS